MDHQTSSIWVGGRTDILITVAILLEVDGLVRMTRRFWSFAGLVAELDILSDLLFYSTYDGTLEYPFPVGDGIIIV